MRAAARPTSLLLAPPAGAAGADREATRVETVAGAGPGPAGESPLDRRRPGLSGRPDSPAAPARRRREPGSSGGASPTRRPDHDRQGDTGMGPRPDSPTRHDRPSPGPAGPGHVFADLGDRPGRLEVRGRDRWDAVDEPDRPERAAYCEGLGWVVAVPVRDLN